MAKKDWGQKSGGWSPFAASSPKAKTAPSCYCYEAFNRATGEWFTQKCGAHR